jgi:hypothetical protein
MPVISVHAQASSSTKDDGRTDVKGIGTSPIPTKIIADVAAGDRESHGKAELESTARIGSSSFPAGAVFLGCPWWCLY